MIHLKKISGKRKRQMIVAFLCLAVILSGIAVFHKDAAALEEKLNVTTDKETAEVVVTYPAGLFEEEEASVVCYDSGVCRSGRDEGSTG